ncbi:MULTISPECIES: hypothetical protein [unclassified Campylobacter]
MSKNLQNATIKASEPELIRIVYNLLISAIKYTNKGGDIKIKLQTRAKA